MCATHLSIVTDRAEALFVSFVPTGAAPTRTEVDAAVDAALDRFGGLRGCAAAMAAAFGDQPELAVHRMRWALGVAAVHPPKGAGRV